MIDTHLHLFETGFERDGEPGCDLAHYQQLRAEHGIDQGLIVGFEGYESFAGNNSYILGLAREHPWMVPLVYLDPSRISADPDLLARHRGDGAAGWVAYVVGPEACAAWLAVPDQVWQLLDQPVVWSFNIDPESLVRLTPRLAQLAQVTILISHLGLPGRATGSPAERLGGVLASVPKLARGLVKVSGLYAIAEPAEVAPFASVVPYLELVRDGLGVERLVWGSDFSPVLGRQDFASQVDVGAYGVFTADEVRRLQTDTSWLP